MDARIPGLYKSIAHTTLHAMNHSVVTNPGTWYYKHRFKIRPQLALLESYIRAGQNLVVTPVGREGIMRQPAY
jgi:hypothetical protein